MKLAIAERTRLEAVKGIVFDIQRYSVHDGPGVRTNVFLKGCPLRCEWCADPESQQIRPQFALTTQNCINCGQFATACTVCWQQRNTDGMSDALERTLDERVAVCPTGAIHWIGEWGSAGDIIQEVLRDQPFYGNGGGLTLTGGEPTMQPALCEAVLHLAKDAGIATAMETCGYTQWVVYERLLPYLDTVLYDVKHVNTTAHRQHTGVDNTLILDNLVRLAAIGAPVRVRVPLIPGFNAEPADIAAIADFVRGLPGPVLGVDLLPYHSLGKAKYAALGREYPWAGHERLREAEIKTSVEIVRARGLPVTVGG